MPIAKAPGSWTSPLTSERMVQKANSPAGIIQLEGNVFVLETRPTEKGRNALLMLKSEGPEDVLPQHSNIRTKVHEYGGSCIATNSKDVIFYSEFSDQFIYKVSPGQQPQAVLKAEKLRFANFAFDASRNALFAVMEDHRQSDLTPENSIVKIDLATGNIVTVCSGYDFYAYPRLNPGANKLAYLCWNHPQMPWDGTELFIADLDEQGLIEKQKLISGGIKESVVQPEWQNEKLLYISDKSGWWNLYAFEHGKEKHILKLNHDFAKPMWGIGSCSYKPLSESTAFVTWCVDSQWRAGILNTEKGDLKEFELPYNSFASICGTSECIYFIGTSFSALPEAVKLNPNTGEFSCIYQSAELPVPQEYISQPESIEFDVAPGQKAHAFYYPPHNPEYILPTAAKPPLLVTSHGGPTASASSTLNLSIQFWTSRGFAVVDVNYGGSSGFGREYRDRLKGAWGIVDVRDCEKAALYLVEKGLADNDRIAIRGGSAGGFTTLCGLTFTDTFKAGASYFGLSDLEALAKETHKFESRYMDNLLGPYPEKADLYKSRSPINSAEKLSCPIIFLQGLEDKVVPPNQAEVMFDILRKKGISTAYATYKGEGHGFRQAENIKHSLEAELYFYCKVFNLECEILQPPVEIHNLV